MVLINELRIGNYISIQGKVKRISLVSNDAAFSKSPVIRFEGEQQEELQSCGAAEVQPVLLSDLILSQCGFVFHDYFKFWQLVESSASKRFELDIDSDYNIIDFMRRPIIRKVRSLHQLQNICFILKGAELNFQPDLSFVSSLSIPVNA